MFPSGCYCVVGAGHDDVEKSLAQSEVERRIKSLRYEPSSPSKNIYENREVLKGKLLNMSPGILTSRTCDRASIKPDNNEFSCKPFNAECMKFTPCFLCQPVDADESRPKKKKRRKSCCCCCRKRKPKTKTSAPDSRGFVIPAKELICPSSALTQTLKDTCKPGLDYGPKLINKRNIKSRPNPSQFQCFNSCGRPCTCKPLGVDDARCMKFNDFKSSKILSEKNKTLRKAKSREKSECGCEECDCDGEPDPEQTKSVSENSAGDVNRNFMNKKNGEESDEDCDCNKCNCDEQPYSGQAKSGIFNRKKSLRKKSVKMREGNVCQSEDESSILSLLVGTTDQSEIINDENSTTKQPILGAKSNEKIRKMSTKKIGLEKIDEEDEQNEDDMMEQLRSEIPVSEESREKQRRGTRPNSEEPTIVRIRSKSRQDFTKRQSKIVTEVSTLREEAENIANDELEAQLDEILPLETRVEDQIQENDKLKEEAAESMELEAQLKELQNRVEVLTQENNELKEQAKKLMDLQTQLEELLPLKSQVEDLTKENNELKEQATKLMNPDENEAKLEALTKENLDLKNLIETLKSELGEKADISSKLVLLTQENDQLKKSVEQLKAAQDKLIKEKEEKEKNFLKLKNDCEKAKQIQKSPLTPLSDESPPKPRKTRSASHIPLRVVGVSQQQEPLQNFPNSNQLKPQALVNKSQCRPLQFSQPQQHPGIGGQSPNRCQPQTQKNFGGRGKSPSFCEAQFRQDFCDNEKSLNFNKIQLQQNSRRQSPISYKFKTQQYPCKTGPSPTSCQPRTQELICTKEKMPREQQFANNTRQSLNSYNSRPQQFSRIREPSLTSDQYGNQQLPICPEIYDTGNQQVPASYETRNQQIESKYRTQQICSTGEQPSSSYYSSQQQQNRQAQNILSRNRGQQSVVCNDQQQRSQGRNHSIALDDLGCKVQFEQNVSVCPPIHCSKPAQFGQKNTPQPQMKQSSNSSKQPPKPNLDTQCLKPRQTELNVQKIMERLDMIEREKKHRDCELQHAYKKICKLDLEIRELKAQQQRKA